MKGLMHEDFIQLQALHLHEKSTSICSPSTALAASSASSQILSSEVLMGFFRCICNFVKMQSRFWSNTVYTGFTAWIAETIWLPADVPKKSRCVQCVKHINHKSQKKSAVSISVMPGQTTLQGTHDVQGDKWCIFKELRPMAAAFKHSGLIVEWFHRDMDDHEGPKTVCWFCWSSDVTDPENKKLAQAAKTSIKRMKAGHARHGYKWCKSRKLALVGLKSQRR